MELCDGYCTMRVELCDGYCIMRVELCGGYCIMRGGVMWWILYYEGWSYVVDTVL